MTVDHQAEAALDGDGAAVNASANTEDHGKTFTQADLDRIVSDRLARERKQVADKYGDLDALKSSADELNLLREGEKTELQKLAEQLAGEQSARQAVEAERDAMRRTQYGIDKGLPAALAKRLQGATSEDLDAEIEELLPLVAKSPEPQPLRTGGLYSGLSGSIGSTADPRERAANAVRQMFDR